jgi:hypothetical protein
MNSARPEAVVSALTNLPQKLDLRRITDIYESNNRTRTE